MTVTRPEPVPADGAPPDAEPIDVTTIRATVDRALQQGPLPRYDHLVDLERLLRWHIDLLLPVAEQAVGGLWRGDVDWYGQRSFLDLVRARLADDLGPGMVSASVHVRQLGHDCRALLKYAPTDGEA